MIAEFRDKGAGCCAAAICNLNIHNLRCARALWLPVLQPVNFCCGQMPKLSRRKASVREEGKAHSLQLHHSLARALKHSAHLVVAPFHQGDFIPRLFAL